MNPRMILLEGDRFWILCLFPIMHRSWYESDDADSVLDGGNGYSHVNSSPSGFFHSSQGFGKETHYPHYCLLLWRL